MSDKVRATFYIDKELYELLRTQSDNISETVNRALEAYLSVNDAEKIKKEIEEHKRAIQALEAKLQSMSKEEQKREEHRTMVSEAWEELRKRWKIRVDSLANYRRVPTREQNLAWLTSPANIALVRQIGMDVEKILDKLEQEY